MEIVSVTTKNFGRLGSVHIDLKGAKVHLFCGPNESGKSTLSEAVRFALLGDSPRLELKKDHDLLVTDGHSKGRVTLAYLQERGAIEQTVYRDVHTNGSATKEFKLDDLATTCFQIALQARTFAQGESKDRRKFLTNLLEIQLTATAIAERLKAEYAIPEAYLKTITPLLRGGFDAAHRVAKDEMSKARGAWESATGEAFGSKKAIEWKPKDAPQPVPEEDFAKARADLAAAEKRLEEAIGAIAHADGSETARESLTKERDKLVALKDDERKLRSQKGILQVRNQGTETDLADLREQKSWADAVKDQLVCPQCDAPLHLKNGVLQPVSVTEIETVIDRGNAAEGSREEVEAKIKNTEKKLRDDQQLLASVTVQLERIANADTLISEIDLRLGKLGDAKNVNRDKLLADREEARHVQEQARLAFDQLRDKNGAVEQHEQKARQAAKSSEAYFAWEKAADALAPEGLPAKLLADALGPINLRLEASSALAGWARVQLNNDVELVRSTKDEPNRRLSLISESAQWRAGAVMADAISSLSALKVLVLDRADVLDLPGRKQLFSWAHKLAEDDYDTILIFATMKEKPTSEAVNGARVHWLPDITLNQTAAPEK